MDFISGIIASPFICLGWLIVGAAAGALARYFMGSADRSFFNDFLLGIIGAIFGGLVAGILGLAPQADRQGIDLVIVNLVVATIGAMLLIGLRRMLFRG
jgi:uncharacterized membrane protein YeaQ/YmgE (transglycosylase-associated protein family)